jgi:RimJ/RimL family protein N-acetyltransferase
LTIDRGDSDSWGTLPSTGCDRVLDVVSTLTRKSVEALETRRLLLEPFDQRHRRSWRSICRDPEVMRFIGGGEIWEMSLADDVFDRSLTHWREHGFGGRAVFEKRNGDCVGFTTLRYVDTGAIEAAAGEVEIGWRIARRAWGNGYATEAAAESRDQAFGSLKLSRIIARMHAANSASIRVAEKIGMRLERGAGGRHGEPVRIYSIARESSRPGVA